MVKLKIDGMSCMHCVARVQKALDGVKGVTSADVSLENGEATVNGDFDVNEALAAVTDAGYDCKRA